MHTVVIGAGLLGVCTAYCLQQHGLEVTVVEAESGPALGASYGNGGYQQATVPDPWNAPGIGKLFLTAWKASLSGKADESPFVARTRAIPGLLGWGRRFLRHANEATYLQHTVANWRLAQYTLQVTQAIAEAEHISYHASHAGGLILFRSEDSLSGYEALAKHVAELGSRYERLDREALFQREPTLAPLGRKLAGAIYYPNDHAGDARAYCVGLAEAAQARGARFEYGQAVTDLKPLSDGVQVQLGGSTIKADRVVICAGVGSTLLAKKLGIKIPIAPAKGYSISVPMKTWEVKPTHVMADMGVHAGVNPMGDTLRVAGTAEFSGHNYDISPGRVDYLIGLLRELYPEKADEVDPAEIQPWAGLRPLCADGLPLIGPTPVPHVLLNTGHGGLGWTQAAGSGKALADQIVGLEPDLDLSPFALSRFNS